MELRQALTAFVQDELFGDGTEIDAEENLLEDGMIDSLGMLRLAAFIQEREGVKIDPGEFTIDNFRSINVIVDYVGGLKSGQSAVDAGR